jgi:carbon monoxide dehydrogenase subunit G
MEFNGEYRFNASALEVWLALNDTEVLMRTIPGCDAMERITASHYAGHLTVDLGLFNAGFKGTIKLSELDPPTSYRISVEAQAPIAGTASGSAKVRLVDLPGGAMLHYTAETAIGGRLAKLGVKLMHGAATRYADKFFARFAQAMNERHGRILTATEMETLPPG